MQQKAGDRTVLVVLRQGSFTPDGPEAVQAREIVQGVASWGITPTESLELFGGNKVLVATFRDWSFVKFLEPKSA